MRLKSYFAETVEAALEQARKELGPEAMLIYSREALPEARYLGRYEVVLAHPGDASRGGAAPLDRPAETAAEPCRAASAEPQVAQLAREVAWLKGQIERLSFAAARGPRSERRRVDPQLAAMLDRLEESGLTSEIAETLADRLQARPELQACLAAGDAAELEALLRTELGSMFSTDPRLGEDEPAASAVALVGPPGSGKTTTLVKLAVAYGLARRRPVKLISADMWRLGGAEQLRSYAAILGVPFETVETPGALAVALSDLRPKHLALIDTPGYGARDQEAMAELRTLFAGRPGLDIHLTLSASMKPADLKMAVARYEQLRPSKLLFTRLDETSTPGSVAAEAIRTAMSVSFLTNGQQIPEDLVEASRERILDLLFQAETSAGATAPLCQSRLASAASGEARAPGGKAAAA